MGRPGFHVRKFLSGEDPPGSHEEEGIYSDGGVPAGLVEESDVANQLNMHLD
jgi:hypothetical protein